MPEARGLQVTVHDYETGTSETKEVPAGDYVLITVDPCHLANVQQYPTSGTVVLTVKGRTV